MFQLRALEMVHWDYWQRLTVPLDAQIVTITGPNGSGKTTLLDALRTLLALRCSGKRDYKRYVRNNRSPFAWLRGVVDNPRRLESGLYPTPFFPLMSERVTLLCRVRKQGGDWVRHYAILEGDVPLGDELEAGVTWLGVHEYRQRLEAAGLTPAIAEVLALEQGDTDKLCEYSPRALLDLVFQVFGDKAVLDHYAAARDEQVQTEIELAELAKRRDVLAARVENAVGRANRYVEWRALQDEIARLESEVLPTLGYIEGRGKLRQHWRDERAARAAWRRECEAQTLDQADLAGLARAEAQADARRVAASDHYRQVLAEFQSVREACAGLDAQLKERDRLQALSGKDWGDDQARLAARHEMLRQEAAALGASLKARRDEREQLGVERAALSSGGRRAPDEVRAFRIALEEQGVDHGLLAERVEVTDPDWQIAVESLLKPYRHLVLLGNPSDRETAFALGRRLRYRHFIVPDAEPAPRAKPGSVLEVVRFASAVPGWLARILNDTRRVADEREGEALGGEWITPDGYLRERRGGRHIGVAAHDLAFGEAARQARLAQVEARLERVNRDILAEEERQLALNREARELAEYLGGVDAIRLLEARADEYAALEASRRDLAARAADIGAAVAAAQEAERQARDEHDQARRTHERRALNLQQQSQRLSALQLAAVEARRMVRRDLASLRDLARRLDPSWLDAGYLEALSGEFGDAGDAEHALRYARQRLELGEWEREETVLTSRDLLRDELVTLDLDMQKRGAEVERASTLTDEARSAYVGKLRATVRAYGRNLKRLGELSGIAVEADLPEFGDDDSRLLQAGLTVRFNFDHKGMMGLNDGEASGGQQVMKSLILLVGLMMDESQPSGFVFIDEPFAHLDIFNIDRVSSFLRATEAQYLITTPNTHNINIFAPSELTLATRKKRAGEAWAPPLLQVRRKGSAPDTLPVDERADR